MFVRIAPKITIFPFVCLPINVYFLGMCSFQKPNDGLGYSHDTLCEREKYKDTVRHGSALVTSMCLFYNVTRLGRREGGIVKLSRWIVYDNFILILTLRATFVIDQLMF